jgi:uncharacterized membrane protein YraQ (UPF0718 family)
MYSIINFAFWSWAYALIIHFNLFPTPIKISLEQSWYCWLILVVLTLITATITAYCIGFIYQKRIFLWPAKNLFKLKTIDPTETAWDWLFLQAKPFLLQITLKDGVEIYGLYGENSFISSKEDDRDIFLEYQYKVGKGGQYEQVDDNEGIYIPRDSIKFFAIKIQKE